ncbi:MAG: hypothetical protein GOU99_03115 [Candidatus Altiarchaeota archaeon]|nr:hypothetical protein [Candidatus Altiarchaeota archaeon]
MNWKKAFVLAFLFFIFADFFSSGGDFPFRDARADHRYHIVKFKLVNEHGIGEYAEIGNIPIVLFAPPLLWPLLFLGKILPVSIAYFSAFFILIAAAYIVSKKIIPEHAEDVLLNIFFPVCLLTYFRFGRLLELMAHLAFLILLYNLDKGKRSTNTLLFLIGASSHLPTAVFYSVFIGLKTVIKRDFKQIGLWVAVGLAWCAIYIPPATKTIGWVLSRNEFLYNTFLASGKTSNSLILGTAIILIIILISVTYFGPEGRLAFPAIFLSIIPSAPILFGKSVLRFLPGFNQVVFSTVFPLYSYLLLKKSEKFWKLVVLVSILFFLSPLPWAEQDKYIVPNFVSDNYSSDLYCLNQIQNNYTLISPQAFNNVNSFFTNYLVDKGLESPFCPIWEYNKPEWFLFNPSNCDELDVGLDYIIFPVNYSWAKSCGDYFECENILVVKLDKEMQGG